MNQMRRTTMVVVLVLGATLLPMLPSAARAQTPSPPGPQPVPSPSPRPAPSGPGAPPADRSVVDASTIQFATFVSVLRAAASPMAADAQAIYDRCTQAQIDCAFVLAVARKEAQYATDGQWIGNFNWGNLRCSTYARCFVDAQGRRWRQYTSFVDATDDWLHNLQAGYISQGLTTVATILPKYAPANENDTAGYIRQVLQWMDEWERGQAQPTPPPATSSYSIDSVFRAPMDGFSYDQVRTVTSAVWHFNAAALRTTATLRQISDRVTLTFGDTLAFSGSLLQGTATQLIALGLAIAACALLLLPLIGRQMLISVRAVPWLLLIVLAGFPSAGVAYLTMEGMRRDFADTIYTRLFDAADTGLRGDQPTGTSGNLGEIAPLFDGSHGRHALDVAAAYLMTDRADLEQDTLLPTRFQQTFFPQDSETLEHWIRPVRAEAYTTAWRGMERMLSGTVFVALAEVEELLLLTIGLSLGSLALALLIALTFAIVQPILRVVDALGRQLWQLFIGSLVISAIQAFVLALLFWRATLDLPTQVLVWGSIALFLELMLLCVVVLGVVFVFWQAGKTTLRWRVLAGGATLTQSLGARLPQPVARPSFAPVSAALGALAGGALGGLAARHFGASRQAAFAYAVSGSKVARGIGAGALAFGKLPATMEHGLRVGTLQAHGKPVSLRGLLAARRAFGSSTAPAAPAGQRAVGTPPPPSPTAPPPASKRSHPSSRRAPGGRTQRTTRQWQTQNVHTTKQVHDLHTMADRYAEAGLHDHARALRAAAERLRRRGARA